jgi:hypothetical protein
LEGDDGDIKNEMKRVVQMSKRNPKEESEASQVDQELKER